MIDHIPPPPRQRKERGLSPSKTGSSFHGGPKASWLANQAGKLANMVRDGPVSHRRSKTSEAGIRIFVVTGRPVGDQSSLDPTGRTRAVRASVLTNHDA